MWVLMGVIVGSCGDRPSARRRFPAPWSTDIALSARTHERVGEKRVDEAWLEATWPDPATRIVPVAVNRFPVDEAGETVRWQAADGLPEGGLRVFLGVREDVAHFALLVEEPTDDGRWTTLREVVQRLREPDAGFMVHAIALAEWHASHRFCPRCGGRLHPTAAGHVLTCDQCGRQQFPRSDPAVIMMVTDGEPRAAGAGSRRGRPGATPRWPGSSTRARAWRRPWSARSRRRSGSPSRTSPTSATSPGRSRRA